MPAHHLVGTALGERGLVATIFRPHLHS